MGDRSVNEAKPQDHRKALLDPFGDRGGSVLPPQQQRATYGTEVLSLQDLGQIWHQANLGGSGHLTAPYRESWLIHACVNARCRFVSQVPFDLWASTDEDSDRIDSGDLYDLLAHPNEYMSGRRLWWLTVMGLDLDGESLWLLHEAQARDNGTQVWAAAAPGSMPGEIMPIRGSKASPQHNDRTGEIEGWNVVVGESTTLWYPRESVVRFSLPDSEDMRKSLGWVNAAARVAEQAFQIERYDDALLKRGGIPGVALQTKEFLTTDQMDQAQQRLEEKLEGAENAWRPTVFGAGLTPVQLGMSPADMQHGDLRLHVERAIMALSGVTKPLLGITDDVNRANAREARAAFAESTGVPLLKFLEDEFQEQFLRRLNGPESDYAASFDTNSIEELSDGLDARVERAVKLTQGAALPFPRAAAVAEWDIDEALLEDEGTNVPEEASPAPEQTLNGAQIKSMLDVILQVAQGVMPKEAAVQLLVAAFPFDEVRARKILAPVVEGSAAPQEPAPVEPPGGDEPGGDAGGAPRAAALNRSVMNSRADRQAILDRQREIKAPFESRIERRVSKVMRDYLGAFRERIRDVREGRRSVSVSMAKATEGDLLRELLALAPLIDDFAPEIASALGGQYSELFAASARQLASEIGRSGAQAPELADWAVGLNARSIQVAEGVTSTLANETTQAIVRKLLDGEPFTTGTLTDAILERFDEIDGEIKVMRNRLPERAQTIARTETAAVANQARAAEMRLAGIRRQVWISELDEGSREDHAALDGQTREDGQSFKEGVELKFPHDPAAPASEVVNCGCSIAPAIDDDFEEALDALIADV